MCSVRQPVTFEELEQAHDWSRDSAQRSHAPTHTQRPSGKLHDEFSSSSRNDRPGILMGVHAIANDHIGTLDDSTTTGINTSMGE